MPGSGLTKTTILGRPQALAMRRLLPAETEPMSLCNFLLCHFPINTQLSVVAVRTVSAVCVVILVMFVESIRFYYVSDNLSDNGLP